MGITQQIGASSLIKPGVVDNTAARPASPYEGQVIYQKDTDAVLVWNGTAWYPNWNLPWGKVGSVSKTTDTSITTTAADISGLSITWTAVAGRMYKVSFQAIGYVNTGNAYIDVSITDSSNTRVQFIRATGGVSSTRFGITGFVYESSLSGSVTRKVRVACDSGTANFDGAASYPTQFIIEDIGPA